MKCPRCGAAVRETGLVKLDGSYLKGISEPVEYRVMCPHCRQHIGKMLWGKFYPINSEPNNTGVRIFICPSCKTDLSETIKRLKTRNQFDASKAKCPTCKSPISKIVLDRIAQNK